MVFPERSFGILKIVGFVLVAAAALVCPALSRAGWIADWNLSDNPNPDYVSANNARPIAIDDSGNVHVVWYQNLSGNWDIFYKSLTGAGWSDPERLTTSGAASAHPTLLAEGDGRVHVFWD